jgi:hypothetical protein
MKRSIYTQLSGEYEAEQSTSMEKHENSTLASKPVTQVGNQPASQTRKRLASKKERLDSLIS